MTHLTLALLHDLEGDKPATNNVPKGPSSLQMALKGKYKAPETPSSSGGKKKKKKMKSHKDKEECGEKSREKQQQQPPRRKNNKVAQQQVGISNPADRNRSPHYYDASSSQYRPQPKLRATARKMSFTIGEDSEDESSTTNSTNPTTDFRRNRIDSFEEEMFESFAVNNGMEEQRKRKHVGNKEDETKLDTSVPELQEEDPMVVESTELVKVEMGSRKNEDNKMRDSVDRNDVKKKRKRREKNKEKKRGLLQPHREEENGIVAMAPSSDIVVADSDDEDISALELQMNAFERKILAMMERRERDLKVIEELRMTQEENRTEIRMLQLAQEGDRNTIQQLQEDHEKDHAAICDMRTSIKNSERQQLLFMTSALNSLSRVFKRR